MLSLDLIPACNIAIYSDRETKETYLELWGASTKHPDISFNFSNYKDKCEWLDDVSLIYQWLLFCSSKLSFPFHSYELSSLANEIFEEYRGW